MSLRNCAGLELS